MEVKGTMCYYSYGIIDGKMNDALRDVLDKNKYYNFLPGKYNDLFTAIKKGGSLFRLTNGMCDCDTPIGSGDTSSEGVKKCSELALKLKELNNISHLYICKKWFRDKLEDNVEIHIDDIDNLDVFFANIMPNTIYKIGVYKRYY